MANKSNNMSPKRKINPNSVIKKKIILSLLSSFFLFFTVIISLSLLNLLLYIYPCCSDLFSFNLLLKMFIYF